MMRIDELKAIYPHNGKIEWIGLRPEKRVDMRVIQKAEIAFTGLVGDRRESAGKRTVTLMQFEHLAAVASMMRLAELNPAQTRRNIMVSGINLITLRDQKFQIGNAVLQGTGICAPCSRMESTIGVGGYNAMRSHGGITAQVITEGKIQISDEIRVLPD